MSFIDQLFSLEGRIALVTGSSSGIGRALASGLAAAGAHVIINGRDAAKAQSVANAITDAGFKADCRTFDVTDMASVRSAIDGIENEIGPVDILVNNAGMQHRSPLEEFPEEAWHRIMACNLDSVFFVSQAVARRMLPRGRGKIINICSVMSELGRASIAPYAATKGGVKMLTKGMAADWGPKGIQVNGIGPGYFRTELNKALSEDKTFTAWLEARTPMRRWGEVEELVGAAIYLAAPASSFVNGHILYVDGAITSSV